MEEAQPLVSIIIPTYNRPVELGKCLEAIAQLDYPRTRFEVIIVDDGSATSLENVVAPYQSQLNLTLLTRSNGGPAAARNTGAKQAKGEYLAFTDDDCLPTSTWLQALAARLATTPASMVGGKTINALPDNPYATTSQNIIDVAYAYYHATPNPLRFFASNNFALPAEGFHCLGGFNESFYASEDREFCARWLHAGYKMTYAPEAVILHAHNLNLVSLWQQHFNYGRGAFRFHQLRAKRDWGSFRVEHKFYLDLLRYPLASPSSSVLLLALLFVVQVANAAGFFWEKSNRSDRI